MHVYFKTYTLQPLKGLNRLSGSKLKTGVHLKIKKRFTEHFADFFPHEELGDMPVELFLDKFKFQDNEYEQKVFHYLLNEEKLRSQKIKAFLNHQLWDGVSTFDAPVIKYKLKDREDDLYLVPLKNNLRIRLDANGMFNQDQYTTFIKNIPKEYLHLIDYLEDPLPVENWQDLGVKLAQDFIKGEPAQVLIHKPNARFLPKTDKKVIFSSYLGSSLGVWHSYCELLEQGNLQEIHGIITKGFYQEEFNFLPGFVPDQESIKNLYDDLSKSEWKLLCSI